MSQQHSTDFVEGPAPSAEPLPRYVTPVTATIRIAAIAMAGAGVLLALSGLLTWFTATIPANGTNTFPPKTFSAYHWGWASAWYASVPMGWVLLAVCIVLGYAAARIVRARHAGWLFRVAAGCCLLSLGLFFFVLYTRDYVREQIPLDLRNATATFVAQRPEARAVVEKQLAGLTVSAGVGVSAALATAAACTLIAFFIAMKSRRPRQAPSA